MALAVGSRFPSEGIASPPLKEVGHPSAGDKEIEGFGHMALAFRQIKVYSKLTVAAVVVGLVVVVVFKNRANKADVWLFKFYDDVPTLWLMLVTSLAAVVTWWLLWSLRRLIVDWRQLRKEQGAEAKLAEQQRLARELADREQRLDDKLKDSISKES